MSKKYKGLSNVGATCYMNSLLQTLFMTPEFRYGIYKWTYNEKIHPKEADSIIFQLQKIFSKLQTDFTNQIHTKQLIKSFQWEDEEAHMQQDIQQFNRLLFQALQKSLTATKSQKYIQTNFVKDYFEGQLIHYTKCHQCFNQSSREEFFQDVIITVKNIYQKIYNQKLEIGIQRYLKPEILDENNLYDCQKCAKKTKASRGARFVKMPSLLNIILQRFTFNYFTMERQKINDRVEFPFILNFNDYIDGYDSIPNKMDEDSSEYFKVKNNLISNTNAKRATPNLSTKKNPILQKKGSTPSVAGKTITKPSANTKSFLADMRKKKKLNQDKNQDLFFLNGTGTASSEAKSEVYQTLKNQNILQNSQSQRACIIDEEEKQQQKKTHQNFSNNLEQAKLDFVPLATSLPFLLPPPPLSIVPQGLSIPYKIVQSPQTLTIESQLQKRHQQSAKLSEQKQQQLLELQSKNKLLIETYLKQGPLVYELYAVLVHNGTANHGHYYSYIKSFEDEKWYCFNDERVTQINVLEIQKTFGNVNSNAYALYYRMISQQQNSQSQLNKLKVQIPQYIKQRLLYEKQQIKQRQSSKINNLQNIINLKICYQLYVKQIEVLKSNSLDLVVQKAKQAFNISNDIKKNNIRLRMFNPATQAKTDTYGGRSHLTLDELKISSYKSLLLQIKGDNEEFEEYQVGTISLRIALLQENKKLNSLDESHLMTHKINIKKNQTIQKIVESIKQKRNNILQISNNDELCVIKRHQNNDQTIHQVITNPQNYNKNVDDLTILENQILFVEPQTQDLVWPRQFESQIYRITIRYNKPATNDYNSYLTDSRIKVGNLKNELCFFLQVNPQDIIMKWGTKSGRQLKDMDISLKEAKFITGTQVYFDFGIPAKLGEIRIQLFWATAASPQVFNRLHQFEYLNDVPISGLLKASEVKQKFIHVIKKIKNIELKNSDFRIRQRVNDKIGKIYRQRPMKQQQLIEKRQIAIQLVPDQGMDIKDFSIYFRIWDQQNWLLSDKVQVIVNKNTTMKELSQILSVHPLNQIIKQSQAMCICRILSIHKFNIIDLTQMEWFTMNQDLSAIVQPMFVNTDGLLYIIKNVNQKPRALTKQEEKKFGRTIKPILVKNKPRVQPKQGKSMKIKVIQKQVENEEQEQIKVELENLLQNKEKKQQKI